MILDHDIICSIDYYETNDRYYNLQEYVNSIKVNIPATIMNYGFPGNANGGFNSHFKPYGDKLSYHLVKRIDKTFGQYIYLDIDAMEMFRNLLEEDKLIYKNEDFDFVYSLYQYLLSTRKHFQKGIILKREIRDRIIIKSKAIQIAIAIIKQKVFVKRREIW